MFPPEIIDLFVKELPRSNAVLSPFLLVSKAFYYPARSIIFSRIDLRYQPKPSDSRVTRKTDSQRLLSIFQENNALIQEVRSLHIALSLRPFNRVLGDIEDNPSPTQNRVTYEIDLRDSAEVDPSFLVLLHEFQKAQLVTLEIKRTVPSCYYFALSHFPREGIEALKKLRYQPSLRHLSLSGLDRVPGALIVGNLDTEDHLVTLSVDEDIRVDNPSFRPTRVRQFQRLEEIIITKLEALPWLLLGVSLCGYPILEYTNRPQGPLLPSLRTLRTSFQRDRDKPLSISRILAETPKLEVVSLIGNFTTPKVISPTKEYVAAISHCRSLRTLELRNDVVANIKNTTIVTLTSILSSVLTSFSLSTLVISATYSVRLEEIERLLDPKSEPWEGFKAVLHNTPTVRKVTLNIAIRVNHKTSMDPESRPRRKRLAAALASGLSLDGQLDVECTATAFKPY